MPSTRSSAATKCISEVPGLAKQTSTPPLTSVRTRLSAPFIMFRSRWYCFPEDQPLFRPPVKGRRCMAGIAARRAFWQRCSRKLTAHAAVACEIGPFVDSLATYSNFEDEDDPGFYLACRRCGGVSCERRFGREF